MRFESVSAAELARYGSLPTERPNPATRDLDAMPLRQALGRINAEDRRVAIAVGRELAAVEDAVRRISAALAAGGRLVLFGAGTSGRLGVIEAAECPPTFGTPPGLVQAVMAGGRGSVFKSKEGAEDDAAAGKSAARARVRRGDAVVGIAASGVTPFVLAALEQSRRRGAATILVTSNSRALRAVDVTISPAVGPEALAGSTRMKAGTAAKMVLNMLTTATMLRLGKIYRNWMVDLKPSSKKLRLRAIRLVSRLGGVAPAAAQRLLVQAGGRPKTAIVMARRGVGRREAESLLAASGGFLRPVLRSPDVPRERRGPRG